MKSPGHKRELREHRQTSTSFTTTLAASEPVVLIPQPGVRLSPTPSSHIYLTSPLCRIACIHLNRDSLEVLTALSSASEEEIPMRVSGKELKDRVFIE